MHCLIILKHILLKHVLRAVNALVIVKIFREIFMTEIKQNCDCTNSSNESICYSYLSNVFNPAIVNI